VSVLPFFLSSLSLSLSLSFTQLKRFPLKTDQEHWSSVYSPYHHSVPTIGFASSLSHTIIREAQEEALVSNDNHSIASSSISVTDEELALLGAPWAKEGMLQRKHFWESFGKRSKDKNWLKFFGVVSQGELKCFRFDNVNGGGTSSKKGGGGMGGGDWTVSLFPLSPLPSSPEKTKK